jgi:hypothetical protein
MWGLRLFGRCRKDKLVVTRCFHFFHYSFHFSICLIYLWLELPRQRVSLDGWLEFLLLGSGALLLLDEFTNWFLISCGTIIFVLFSVSVFFDSVCKVLYSNVLVKCN